jgi:energy-coupling factor transport system ATP-binding protein
VVELRAVSYWYPEAQAPALDRIDLCIEGGDRLLVAGLSGAGKSTLLRVLNGLVPHFYGGRFGGEARIAGWEVRRSGPMRLAEHVGMVFQEPQSRFLSSAVEDELAFGLEISGLDSGEIRRRVAEVIERLDLGALMGRRLDRLSTGEQARVAIASALARRPALLALDEPTTELDPVAAQEMVAWLDDLSREHGLTVVAAEHRLGRWLERVERLAYLEAGGRLAAVGPPAEVLQRMPYADPPMEAARRLGLDGTVDPAALVRALQGLPGPEAGAAASAGAPRLSVRGLTFAYNRHPALDAVDLELVSGQVVGLVGRNGSGKTTLLRCLMGLEQPASGAITLDGLPVDGVSVAERARRIGFVSQVPGSMLFAESVEAELEFTLKSHGLLGRPPVDPAWLLETLGLTEVRAAYPRDLSAGQRQRAALAAVMVTRPSVLLLDEPTLGMDPLAQADLRRLIRSRVADGAGVLVASHDVEFIAAVADRVVVLHGGRVVAEGPTDATLFAQPGFRTALQTLTGKSWPAVAEDVVGGGR